jgi:hypothetical protein
MSTSVFNEIATFQNTGSGDRTPLPIGKFGTAKVPGLKVVKVLASKAHPFLPDTESHSYLVAAVDGKQFPGTAFLTIDVRPYTLTNPAVAIAYPEFKEKLIAAGLTTEAEIESFNESLRTLAEQEVVAKHQKVGSEEPASPEELDGKLKNLTIEIQKALGNIFALQVWAGQTPGIDVDFEGFGGTEFSGTTKPNYKQTGTDVVRVYKKAAQ